MARSSRVSLSWALVGVQAVLFLAVLAGALATSVGPRLPSSVWAALALIAAGAFLLVSAAATLGPALTPLPLPNGRGLAAHGVYRWVRHPIYAGVILACLGVAVGAGTVLAYAAVGALVAFFEYKTRVEENWLDGAYDGYTAYAARTGKYLPGVARRRSGGTLGE